jgi:transposase
MGQRGRPTARIVLSDDERETLERWARRRKTQQALALRCRIVLAAADGATNQAIARELKCNPVTVGKWRTRFADKRFDGLMDEPRPGQPRKITDEVVEQVIVATLEETPPDGATQWSTRSMAARVGLNQTAVSRIWRTFGLKPHRIEDFKLSTDPQFIDKVRDVVGLYLNPPDAAVVLCVDEKTQVQALDRTAPVLPMLPGTPARQTYTYVRNGTSDLYAALDVASGKVITKMTDQHRAVEFRAFLNLIDKSVPAELTVHVICDNASTHKAPEIVRWLKRHRRFTLHYTPTYSSWLNQVERWFSELTTKKLRTSNTPQRHRTPPRHQRLGRTLEREPPRVHLAQNRRRDPRQPRLISPTNQRLTTLAPRSETSSRRTRLEQAPIRLRPIRRWGAPLGQTPSTNSRNVSTVFVVSGPTGFTLNTVTPASL